MQTLFKEIISKRYVNGNEMKENSSNVLDQYFTKPSVGDENVRFEEELAKDVLEIITVFSARLYGSRSKKNKKLLDEMQEVITNNVSYLNHA